LKELKKIEKKVADKDRELEREKRELEQLRSYLTASAPLQEIDSLPKFASTIW
jgi:vacuolar-type H+-ATPase subunit I/STV1